MHQIRSTAMLIALVGRARQADRGRASRDAVVRSHNLDLALNLPFASGIE